MTTAENNVTTSSATDSAISISGLEFAYGNRPVLKGIDLEIPRGVAFGVLGANGAGKTTLVRLLIGRLKATGGSATIFGQKPGPELADSVGYMPQLNALYEALSVRENLDFFARMLGLSNTNIRANAVARAMDLVGLSDRADSVMSELSGGMRQRVSLGAALVHEPDLLLLDEPTVGLDPELRATFWQHFKEMTDSGTTILISSHTMDDAAHCNTLGFMRDGKFIATGTPDELRATTGKPNATLEDAFLHLSRSST
ncbi:MAG: ABC transporter ATP-binding protein [Chloroflexi bacterium]|nr:ABC transporter ATP-binding protein [Chloroflexota bacterium]